PRRPSRVARRHRGRRRRPFRRTPRGASRRSPRPAGSIRMSDNTSRLGWPAVSLAVFATAWGGNEFTPLLVMYRQISGLSPVVVDALLFAYVFGIVPALLIGGPLSDRFGRRPLMLPAPVFAALGSVLLAAGSQSVALLTVG